MFEKAQRLCGAKNQLLRVTRACGGGGVPTIRPCSRAVAYGSLLFMDTSSTNYV
jgi:hypothetical protein